MKIAIAWLGTSLFLWGPLSEASARHRLGLGWAYTVIRTTEADTYTLFSPTLNYTFDFHTFGAHIYMSTSALVPLWARQDEARFYTPDYYTHCLGTNLFIGLSTETPFTVGFTFLPIVGWHLNGIRLRAKPAYLDFYSLTTGPGVTLIRRPSETRRLFNHAFFSLGYDTMDLLYIHNKLKRGITLDVGIGHTF